MQQQSKEEAAARPGKKGVGLPDSGVGKVEEGLFSLSRLSGLSGQRRVYLVCLVYLVFLVGKERVCLVMPRG